LTFDGVNAEKAAPSLRTPALFIAADLDGDFAIYARAIYDETPDDLGQLLVVNASQHGVRLVGDPDSTAGVAVRDAIEDFLAAHLVATPASPTPGPS
jgi:hypothetical protein